MKNEEYKSKLLKNEIIALTILSYLISVLGVVSGILVISEMLNN